MRVNPSEKAIRGKTVDPKAQARVEKICRIVAIVVSALSTFGLFVKILFF